MVPSAHDARLVVLEQSEEAIAYGVMTQQKHRQQAVRVVILLMTDEYKTYRPWEQIWQMRDHVSRNVSHYIFCIRQCCLLATAGSATIAL